MLKAVWERGRAREREREGEREGEVNRGPERRAADVWVEISFITSTFPALVGNSMMLSSYRAKYPVRRIKRFKSTVHIKAK